MSMSLMLEGCLIMIFVRQVSVMVKGLRIDGANIPYLSTVVQAINVNAGQFNQNL